MNELKKIVVASPRFLLANGIRSYFESKGIKVVVSNATQDSLERLLIAESPDLVIIDDYKELFKIEKTIAFLSFTKPATTVLVSDKLNQERHGLLSKVGIRYFLSSEVNAIELATLFDELKGMDGYIDSSTKTKLSFNAEEAFRNTCAELNISEREVEIIKLIAEGFINKEIADKLFLSTHTVNTHRKNIMGKLGVSNATGIVIFAVKEKLISPKDFLFSSKH